MSVLRVGGFRAGRHLFVARGRKRPQLFDIVDLWKRDVGSGGYSSVLRAVLGWFVPVRDGLGTEDLGSIMSCNFKVVMRFTRMTFELCICDRPG
jgi:hypothetical protein